MRAVKRRPPAVRPSAGPPADSSRAATILLRELRAECENVVRLIRRLETHPRAERARDEILGELSAAVLHLHAHTEGLDDFLCSLE